MKTPIAFFDVDGTLMQAVSGYHATLELIKKRLLKKRRIATALFYKAISRFYIGNVRKFYEIAANDLSGISINTLLEIGREVFHKSLKPQLYTEAIEVIEAHRHSGHRLVLISSGPYMVIKILEEFLGMHHSFSASPVIENGVLQNRLTKPFSFWHGKVEIAKIEAQNYGVSLADCYYYADGYHDLPLLSEVGHPYAVNPEKRLLRAALKKGWPILNFKKLLGES